MLRFQLYVVESISACSSKNSRQDLVDLRECTASIAIPTLKIVQVNSGPRWPEDGRRKWNVIVSRALRLLCKNVSRRAVARDGAEEAAEMCENFTYRGVGFNGGEDGQGATAL